MPRHSKHEEVKVAGPEDHPAVPDTEPTATDAESAELQAENRELKDRLLRTLAESENARQRIERAAEDTRKYAIADFSRRLLTVADTLERASGAAADNATDASAVAAGIEATQRMLESTLEQAGVRRIDALGARFDPAMHEAVAEIDDTEKEPGSVAEVAEQGYMIHDRLLRPARVVVVKGSPSGDRQG